MCMWVDVASSPCTATRGYSNSCHSCIANNGSETEPWRTRHKQSKGSNCFFLWLSLGHRRVCAASRDTETHFPLISFFPSACERRQFICVHLSTCFPTTASAHVNLRRKHCSSACHPGGTQHSFNPWALCRREDRSALTILIVRISKKGGSYLLFFFHLGRNLRDPFPYTCRKRLRGEKKKEWNLRGNSARSEG